MHRQQHVVVQLVILVDCGTGTLAEFAKAINWKSSMLEVSEGLLLCNQSKEALKTCILISGENTDGKGIPLCSKKLLKCHLQHH